MDGRIVGGSDTTIEENPHQLSLLYYGSHSCGAVVISEIYVLTAAHCTDRRFASELSVRAGSSIRNNGGVVIPVETFYQHPQFDPLSYDFDISVLKLSAPLSFNSSISPISMANLNQDIPVGTKSIVTGWGYTEENGSLPSQLQEVEISVIDLNECNSMYEMYGGVTDRMMCATVPGGQKDACQGDSGGPMVANGVLIGLVSHGEGCARPEFPGVYTSIPALRQYITDITGL